MKALLRRSLVALASGWTLLFASTAFAEGEPCFNDTDCPNPACGGDVCNWNKSSPNPVGDKVFYCQPAGMSPKGSDGWCTAASGDVHCKCAGVGAKCLGTYCSFTKASDAPPGTGGSGTAGSSSTAGTAGTGTAGTGTAGTGTAGTGTTTPAPAKEDDGGCSVGGATNQGAGIALALGAIGLGVAFARRRR